MEISVLVILGQYFQSTLYLTSNNPQNRRQTVHPQNRRQTVHPQNRRQTVHPQNRRQTVLPIPYIAFHV